MPTTLVFSNRTETLLDAFCEALGAARAEEGAWAPLPVIVPNRTHQRFLQQGLTDRMGIAANLDFEFLDGLWRRHLPPGVRLLDQPRLQGLVLALLGDPAFMAHPELKGLRDYREADGDGRRWAQLAAQIATLFEEYALSRPEWLEPWAQGRPAAPGAPQGLEAWQRRLWKGLVDRLRGSGGPWMTLGQFLQGGRFDEARFPPRVFAFGLSQTARVYHLGLQRLGRCTDLHLFTLNPCDEYWTELSSERTSRRGAAFQRQDADEASEDPFGLEGAENGALRAWGRPGRENIRLLCEAQSWNTTDLFDPDPAFTNLLQLVQALIQKNRPFESGTPERADGSLVIHACAHPRREAEAVASQVWAFLGAHPGARFSDVAVIVPPAAKELYLHHLQAAFDAAQHLPWLVADEGSRHQGELLEAADLLLRLPFGAFTRAEVLRVLGHPAVRGRFPELEGDWAALCAELGIIRGTESEGEDEDYFERDLWNWDQGLHRLALGHFMGGDAPFAWEGGAYRPAAPLPQAGAFLALVRGLLADAKALRHRVQSAAAWAEDLAAYLRDFLGAEGSALARLLSGLARLAERELEGLPPLALPFGAAFELAQEALARVKGAAPGALGQGVAVGGFDALRGLPFRAVFILGLGEGVFPGADSRNPFDLRAHRWRPGDVSRPEQDRYAFLEALLCARDALHLTYATRDPLTGATLQPSPVLRDLKAMLAPLLGPEGVAALTRIHPIHRWDAAYATGEWPNHLPEAWREMEASGLGAELRRAAGVADLPARALSGLGDEARARMDRLVHAVPPLGDPRPPERLRITLSQLKRWFECPVQGAAIVRLGLRMPDDEDAQDVETEPFALTALHRSVLLRQAFWRAAQGEDPATALAGVYRRLQEAGEAPIAVFSDVERERLRAVLDRWMELRPGAALHRYRLGAGEASGPVPERPLPPLAFELTARGRPMAVTLEGETAPATEDAFLALSEQPVPAKAGGLKDRDKATALPVWIQHLALRAHGLPSPGRIRFLSAHPEKPGAWILELGEPSPEAAHAHLRRCLETLLTGPWEPLPFEASLTLDPWPRTRGQGERVPPTAEALTEWMQKPRMAPLPFQRGPLPGVADLAPSPRWADQAQARYGDLLRSFQLAGGAP